MRLSFLLLPITTFSCAVIADASSPKYLALADSADMLIRKERWIDAERTIIEALRLEPANFSNSLLFSNLGIVRTNRGDYNSALEAFGLGLNIAPASTVIRNNRAKTYLITGDYDKAMRDIDESLARDSIQEWPLQMRGLLRARNNDYLGAKSDFLLLARLFPDNPAAMEGLGRVAQAEGNVRDALKYYDEAIKMNNNPDTRSMRILLKIDADMYSEAAADIRESIDCYPDYADFFIWRGYLHRLNYRNEEAAADKKIAISKGADPQYVEKFIP